MYVLDGKVFLRLLNQARLTLKLIQPSRSKNDFELWPRDNVIGSKTGDSF